MSAETVVTVAALIDAHRELLPVLEEHLADNYGEVLPHLVMADIVRWLVANVDSRTETCQSILGWMEGRFEQGPDEVRGVFAVSGVEMIPSPGEPGSELREFLGPALRGVAPWRRLD